MTHTLTSPSGLSASFIPFGASLTRLLVPDRDGKLADIALGFDTPEEYPQHGNPYFGCIVGRFGNRINQGRFTLDGTTHQLQLNNGAHHLHGGFDGFQRRVWTITRLSPQALRFTYRSPHGEMGYPGNLDIAVTATLTGTALRFDYEATCDQATLLNPTNHTYFNLGGHDSGTITGHELRIAASRFTPVSSELIPTGEIASVAGTPYDFRHLHRVADQLDDTGLTPAGYDHNFVLDAGQSAVPVYACEVHEPVSGRVMRVHTTEPGLQFYSGNFLDGSLVGKGGHRYRRYGAFCLETQHFPDAPNHPHFPQCFLRPGETFRSSTVYEFSTR